MSIQVNDFRWEPGENDVEYIRLLESSRDEWQKIAQKAISKLKTLSKAQEQRVLTPEELYSQETVWFEEKPNHTMKQLTQDGIAALVFVGLLHNWNGYGTVWRCWTAKPTEEQRKAVKWDA